MVFGWLRFAARLLAILALLGLCLVLNVVWKLARGESPWPRRFLAGLGRIAGIRVKVTGHRVEGGEFLLANHVSWIDIPALGGTTGATFVGHDGLASVPVIRWLCELNGTVFVARHQRSSIAHQVEKVRAAIAETGALTIFPEGTTSEGNALLPFKSSLLSALDPLPPGLSVQPVLLDYGAESADISWIGEEHGVANFRRILSRSKPVELNVHFLAPLAGAQLADRKSIAAAAREAIGHELKARRSRHQISA